MDIFREERVEVQVDNNPRAGFENDLEERVVYRRIEEHIEELRVENEYIRGRFKLLAFASLSFMAGNNLLQ